MREEISVLVRLYQGVLEGEAMCGCFRQPFDQILVESMDDGCTVHSSRRSGASGAPGNRAANRFPVKLPRPEISRSRHYRVHLCFTLDWIRVHNASVIRDCNGLCP